jgi:predicted nucleic acid-binding protein
MGRIAVLDACVLFPGLLRHLLIQLGVDGLYEARWSDEINAEWSRALLRRRPDLSAAAIDRTIRLMNQALPGARACLLDPASRNPRCRDPKDEHVLRLADETRADFIVTFNVRDFPTATRNKAGPLVLAPDPWLCNIWSQAPSAAHQSALRVMQRLQHPPMNISSFCKRLAIEGAASTAQLILAADGH